VGRVAVLAGVEDEFLGSLQDCAVVWGAGDGDSASARNSSSTSSRRVRRARSTVLASTPMTVARSRAGRWTVARPGLAVGDRSADLGGGLLMELDIGLSVDRMEIAGYSG
jgi:hypothetical protein